jgi:hypothetical protein
MSIHDKITRHVGPSWSAQAFQSPELFENVLVDK